MPLLFQQQFIGVLLEFSLYTLAEQGEVSRLSQTLTRDVEQNYVATQRGFTNNTWRAKSKFFMKVEDWLQVLGGGTG